MNRRNNGISELKDVSGCHGNNRGPGGDSWEGPAGSSNINMGVGQGSIRVNPML